MKRLLIILVFAVAGCQQGGAPLTSADIDAIKKNAENFAQAISTQSADAGNGLADDVVSMPPHNTSQCWETKDRRVSLNRTEGNFLCDYQ